MERLHSRAERLRQIELMLFKAHEGLSAQEIARRCGVHRSTVYRDIDSLSATEVPIWQGGGRFGVLRDRYLATVRVHLHEALALFLAARLLTAQSDKHNPHIVSALDKLASVLPEPVAEHVTRTAALAAQRPPNSLYIHVLETLTQAWADRRQVIIWYRSHQDGKITKRVFDPYFIEPSAVGYACYVIGYDHHRQDVRIFKLERFSRVQPTVQGYKIPEDFDPYRYFSTAWGIMGGDPVVEVKLRFSPRVTWRVKESVWHSSQTIEDLPEGGCILTVLVSHTLEMKPWIRGWGANCEVLAPEELRKEIAEEVGKMVEVYGGEKNCSSHYCEPEGGG